MHGAHLGGDGGLGGVRGGRARCFAGRLGPVRQRGAGVDGDLERDVAVVVDVRLGRVGQRGPGRHPDGEVGGRQAVALGELVGAGTDDPGAAARGELRAALAHEVAQPGGAPGVELGDAGGVGGGEVDDRVAQQRHVGQRAGPAQLDERAAPLPGRAGDGGGPLGGDVGGRPAAEGGPGGRRRRGRRLVTVLCRRGGPATAGRTTGEERRECHSTKVGSHGPLRGVPRRTGVLCRRSGAEIGRLAAARARKLGTERGAQGGQASRSVRPIMGPTDGRAQAPRPARTSRRQPRPGHGQPPPSCGALNFGRKSTPSVRAGAPV